MLSSACACMCAVAPPPVSEQRSVGWGVMEMKW